MISQHPQASNRTKSKNGKSENKSLQVLRSALPKPGPKRFLFNEKLCYALLCADIVFAKLKNEII